jgi:hypothetical protein
MAVNYERGPVSPGHVRDERQQAEIKRLRGEVADLTANAFKYGGAAMKRTLIKTGKLYENTNGFQRKVTKISDTPNFIDGHRVTYRVVKGRECGAERYCTMRTFARWAKREVAL